MPLFLPHLYLKKQRKLFEGNHYRYCINENRCLRITGTHITRNHYFCPNQIWLFAHYFGTTIIHFCSFNSSSLWKPTSFNLVHSFFDLLILSKWHSKNLLYFLSTIQIYIMFWRFYILKSPKSRNFNYFQIYSMWSLLEIMMPSSTINILNVFWIHGEKFQQFNNNII